MGAATLPVETAPAAAREPRMVALVAVSWISPRLDTEEFSLKASILLTSTVAPKAGPIPALPPVRARLPPTEAMIVESFAVRVISLASIIVLSLTKANVS